MCPKTPPGQTRNQIFRFVRERLLNGVPPTIREVQDAFGFRSVQTAREHLDSLVDEGRLCKTPGMARGYRLPDLQQAAFGCLHSVPLLGRVQAGALTAAVEDPDGGYIGVHSRAEMDTLFALRVSGESMINAGILPDDIVVVRRQSTALSGEIVVALIDDEATVKTLRFNLGRPELHPENPAFKPIIPGPDRAFSLLGKVIEIRRYLETN